MKRFLPIHALWPAAAWLMTSGCATIDPSQRSQNPSDFEEPVAVDGADPGVWDPLEPMNRFFHEFNFLLDSYVIGPVASAYAFVTPALFRRGVSNFVNNLAEPFTAVNQLLQGKPKRAASDVGRFAINSTAGLGGLFDPAEGLNLVRHDEDLGQTLAVWGLPAGPYLVLPILGPTTLRHVPSIPARGWTKFQLLEVFDAGNLLIPIEILDRVNTRADVDPFGRVRERAIDPYIFIREAYMDRRRFLIYDGDPPFEAIEDFFIDIPLLDDPE